MRKCLGSRVDCNSCPPFVKPQHKKRDESKCDFFILQDYFSHEIMASRTFAIYFPLAYYTLLSLQEQDLE